METFYALSGIQLLREGVWTPRKDPLQHVRQTHTEQITYLLSMLTANYVKEVFNPPTREAILAKRRERPITRNDLLTYLSHQLRVYLEDWDENISLSHASQARLFAGEVLGTLHQQAPSLLSLAIPSRVEEAKNILGEAGAYILVEGAMYANNHAAKKEPKIQIDWVNSKARRVRVNIFDGGIPVIVSEYTRTPLPSYLSFI